MRKHPPVANINNEIKNLAYYVAIAMEDKEFREMLKNEANKRFDGECNVLLEFIKNRVIGERTVSEIISKSSDTSGSMVDSVLAIAPNAQIAIPVNIDKWDPSSEILYTIFLPIDFDDAIEQELIGFKSDGSTIALNSKTPPDFPVVVVSVSERVDEDLMLKVDEDNIVLPKEHRKPAIDAYLSGNYAKNQALINKKEPLVRIVSEEFMDSLRRSDNSANLEIFNGFQEHSIVDEIVKKNSNLAAPSNLTCGYPSTAYTIILQWTPVSGATSYRIYRRNEQTAFAPIATIQPTNIWIDNTITKSGVKYEYYVTAVNSQGESFASNTASMMSAARWQGGREQLRSIYMTRQMTFDLESWARGPHLELVIDCFQANNQTVTGSQWSVFKRDIHRDELAGGWYTIQVPVINTWSLDRGEAYYTLKITEEDNSGDWDFNTTLSYDKKTSSGIQLKTALSYKWKYKKGNDDGGHVHIDWYHSPRQEYETTKGIRVKIAFEHPDAPCPYGGVPVTWPTRLCLVVDVPSTSLAIIKNGWWYYKVYNGGCPLGGVREDGECRYKKIPDVIYSEAWVFNHWQIGNGKGYYPRGF